MFNTALILPAGISNVFPAAGRAKPCRPMTTHLARHPASFNINAAFAQTAPPPPRDYRKTPVNLYEILSVKETATHAEIKTAYRALAKRFHPDTFSSKGSDGRDFIEINRAYATLSDPKARAGYDVSIGAGRRFRYSPINASGFPRGFPTRRWETDQCW